MHCYLTDNTEPLNHNGQQESFSALDIESDSEPESDPEPLSRSHFGGEPTVPSHFRTFELEPTPEPEDGEEPISIEP